MATYTIRNILSPTKVVSCTISFKQLVNKNEEGESVWLAEINTMEPHKNGGIIPTAFIHIVSTTNLDSEIKKATEYISSQINWEPLSTDVLPPTIVDSSPYNNSIVDIISDVRFSIKESLPGAGIDINSLKMLVNDIDVTNQLDVDGDPFMYKIRWKPTMLVYDYY